MKTIIKSLLSTVVILACLNLTVNSINAAAGDVVSFSDSEFKACINNELGQETDADITEGQMGEILFLGCNGYDITSIEGAQYLTSADTLHLEDNLITDVEPLSGLNALNYLSLKNNNIDDITPLSSLTSITHLDLSQNNITNASPVANNTTLKYLYLSENNISDISSLGNLTTLEYLGLTENNVSDISVLSNMTLLHSLYVNGNNIDDITPLKDSNKLYHVEMADNNVTDVTPFTNAPDLFMLNLSNNNISDISAFSTLQSLEFLIIPNNHISDLSPLASASKISYYEATGQTVTLDKAVISDVHGDSYQLPSSVFLDASGNEIQFNSDNNYTLNLGIQNINNSWSTSSSSGNFSGTVVQEVEYVECQFSLEAFDFESALGTDLTDADIITLANAKVEDLDGLYSSTVTVLDRSALDVNTAGVYQVVHATTNHAGEQVTVTVNVTITDTPTVAGNETETLPETGFATTNIIIVALALVLAARLKISMKK